MIYRSTKYNFINIAERFCAQLILAIEITNTREANFRLHFLKQKQCIHGREEELGVEARFASPYFFNTHSLLLFLERQEKVRSVLYTIITMICTSMYRHGLRAYKVH